MSASSASPAPPHVATARKVQGVAKPGMTYGEIIRRPLSLLVAQPLKPTAAQHQLARVGSRAAREAELTRRGVVQADPAELLERGCGSVVGWAHVAREVRSSRQADVRAFAGVEVPASLGCLIGGQQD